MAEIVKAYKNYLDNCGEGVYIPTRANVVVGNQLMLRFLFDVNTERENLQGKREVTMFADLSKEEAWKLFREVYQQGYGEQTAGGEMPIHYSLYDLFTYESKKVSTLSELDTIKQEEGIPLYLWVNRIPDSPLRLQKGKWSSDRSIQNVMGGESGELVERMAGLETALNNYEKIMGDFKKGR